MTIRINQVSAGTAAVGYEEVQCLWSVAPPRPNHPNAQPHRPSSASNGPMTSSGSVTSIHESGLIPDINGDRSNENKKALGHIPSVTKTTQTIPLEYFYMRTFLIPSRSCLPRLDLSLFDERKGTNNEWHEHTGRPSTTRYGSIIISNARKTRGF